MQGSTPVTNLSARDHRLLQPAEEESAVLTTIPIYFIHSFEQPFCDDPACLCAMQRQEIERLFIQIVEGKVEIEKAPNLMHKESEGEHE